MIPRELDGESEQTVGDRDSRGEGCNVEQVKE